MSAFTDRSKWDWASCGLSKLLSCDILRCATTRWIEIMNIASDKLDKLARRLARLTGEDVETALARAVEERLSRIATPEPFNRQRALRKFFDHVSAMPVIDNRSVDAIIGYGPDGLPS
jgi:antitoxin VapB